MPNLASVTHEVATIPESLSQATSDPIASLLLIAILCSINQAVRTIIGRCTLPFFFMHPDNPRCLHPVHNWRLNIHLGNIKTTLLPMLKQLSPGACRPPGS